MEDKVHSITLFNININSPKVVTQSSSFGLRRVSRKHLCGFLPKAVVRSHDDLARSGRVAASLHIVFGVRLPYTVGVGVCLNRPRAYSVLLSMIIRMEMLMVVMAMPS